MASLPYMQLYVADYLADTFHLSTIEHGAYLLLIFNYWQRGESFKAKDQRSLNKRLASAARMSDDEWDVVKETLREFFITTDDEWTHPRIERDLEAVKAKSRQASEAGKASAAKRSRRSAGNMNGRSTDVQRTFNHTDTDTDTDKKEKEKSKKKKVDDGDEGFVQFWTAYPHKVGKVEALRAFGKLKPDGKMLREILAGLERYKANKPAWQEWKNPGPWLNQRRWEDMPHTGQSAASQHPQPDWLQGVV